MTKMNDYDELATNIIELIGGQENFVRFTHCMTRLRFNIKDKALVNVAKVETMPGVVGSQWANNQLQIIIGYSVRDVYHLICKKYGIDE